MNYKKVGAAELEALRGIVGAERALEASAINEDYAHDELSGVFGMPEVLVRVKSTDEVSRVMAYAYEQNIPVVARGSGTGLVGGAVAVEGGILLETLEMNRILELDEKNLTVTVEAGVLLMELLAYTKKHGFLYPPDPGEKSATIGGNISTNAGGMRAVRYGVTRDFVRGLEVVLPNGEVLTLGGKTVKNASGYSLMNLIIGSEGTLGVITKAMLKLIPLPAASLSMLVPFQEAVTAIDAVPEIIKSQADCTAIEFMERETILFAEEFLGKKFPHGSSPAYLLLTVDGHSSEAAEQLYKRTAAQCLSLGAEDVYLVDTDERKDAVWGARGAFLEAIKASAIEMDECDVVVPRSRVAEFIRYTHELSKELSLRMPSFGHAGDGNLHIYLCRDALSKEVFLEKAERAFDALYGKAAEMGGQVSGEHGIGYAKRDYMAAQLGITQMALMRGIKAVFDPKGLLNPHKVV